MLDQVEARPFPLSLGGLGRFRRGGGDIYWVGVECSPVLLQLHAQLGRTLAAAQFVVEERPYKPHLTLGRRVLLPPEFDLEEAGRRVPPLHMEVRRVSLMQSERINGRLTYTEIDHRAL